MHGTVQVEGENAKRHRDGSIAGERWSARPHERSTATDENDQRTSTSNDDIPRAPPEPPPPLTSPDETMRSQDEPPSVELEGERKGVASCDARPTTGDADVAGVPGADEDAREKQTNLPDVLGCEQERSKQRTRENSPRRAREELEDLGCEADVSVTSEGDEDPRNRPQTVQNVLGQARERSKGRSREDSPGTEMKMTRVTARMRRQRRATSRTLGSGQRSCAKRRNALGSAQSPRRRRTHLGGLDMSHMTRAVKRSCQAVSMTSRNALGTSETSAPMKRTHHVVIQAQEGAWRCREARRTSRAIRTAQTLSRTPDTMGNDPRASGMSAMSIRTRYVEIEGQEAIRMRKSSREISAANRSAKAMETASRWTGKGAEWMAQRAAHGATRNESKRDR